MNGIDKTSEIERVIAKYERKKQIKKINKQIKLCKMILIVMAIIAIFSIGMAILSIKNRPEKRYWGKETSQIPTVSEQPKTILDKQTGAKEI